MFGELSQLSVLMFLPKFSGLTQPFEIRNCINEPPQVNARKIATRKNQTSPPSRETLVMPLEMARYDIAAN